MASAVEDRQRAEAAARQAEAAAAAVSQQTGAAGPAGISVAPLAPDIAAPLLVPPAADRAAAAAKVVAGLVSFLTAKRRRDRAWLFQQLRTRAPTDDMADLVTEELEREEEFARKAAERFAGDLHGVLAIPDPAKREAAMRGLLNRERRFAQMRTEAMTARAIAAADRRVLQRESPLGAYWKSDANVSEHTAGCLIMSGGGSGRGLFWPWAVLEHVHPPRHPGCPCTLHSMGTALARGWMRAGDVRDVRSAINMARGVVMEADLADELLRAEDELREALTAAGLLKE